jgi:hypothetical protein
VAPRLMYTSSFWASLGIGEARSVDGLPIRLI